VAHDITDPVGQATALSAVAGALAKAGQSERAVAVARQALSAASVTDPGGQAAALRAVVRAFAEAGQPEQVLWAWNRATTVPVGQAAMWSAVAQALAKAGRPEQALSVAPDITDPYSDEQAGALAALARALAEADQPEQAMALAERALSVAGSVTDRDRQVAVLVDVALALAYGGQTLHACQAVAAFCRSGGRWTSVADAALQLDQSLIEIVLKLAVT
jgi:tetratricopeptide (TPR) repeat protein